MLRFYLMWENKKRASVREAAEHQQQDDGQDHSHYDFRNLTDKENPLFVYVY